ncbi:MAG: NAD-dependent epimerase/dehydratase family protein [Flavobacteriales bacterium]|nr:NAD-dependent epimerase/dehydratase family protein [Flavobacteriales bacterium]
MHIFLTGADGLLGNNLVRILLHRNYKVTVFIQSGKDLGYLKGLDITAHYGDLLNYQELVDASKNADVFINAAAVTDTWPNQGSLYWKVNVDGVKNVIKAVKENNIKRLIHVGTANSFGPGNLQNPGNESTPFDGSRYNLDYITSKYEAQKIVLAEVRNNQLPALIVNPTFMIGPYDVKPSSGKMIISVIKGQVPGYAKGGRNFVYVGDVATAVANSIEKGRIGECYIAAGANLSYKDMFGKIARIFNVKPPSLAIPGFAVLMYGRILSIIGNLSKKEPVISFPLAKISNELHYYSNAKAVKELGMTETNIEDAITMAVDWFKQEKYL